MLVTFTDFGCHGPYLGQMMAVLRHRAPGVEVIDLLNDAPATDSRHSAYLLSALARWWPLGTVFLGVVDPGVGGARKAVVLEADGKWFVGPDNGLFNVVALHSDECSWYEILWRPERLSASFHGRDLFAPVAAAIATGKTNGLLVPWDGPELSGWPQDLAEVVYIDHYGNVLTGLRDHDGLKGRVMQLGQHRIPPATTFCDVAPGEAFWYVNSLGLVEIAVNRGNAAHTLDLAIGQEVRWSH